MERGRGAPVSRCRRRGAARAGGAVRAARRVGAPTSQLAGCVERAGPGRRALRAPTGPGARTADRDRRRRRHASRARRPEMTAMTAQEQSLGELAALLDELRVPYMVIGGMANAVWGEPRATLDIDVTVWVPEPQIGEVIDALAARLEVLVDEPRRFVADTRVLP